MGHSAWKAGVISLPRAPNSSSLTGMLQKHTWLSLRVRHYRGHRLDIHPLILFRLQHSPFLLTGVHGQDFLPFRLCSCCCYWLLLQDNKWCHSPTAKVQTDPPKKMQTCEGGPGGPCHLVPLARPFPHRPTSQERASAWTCLVCQAASHSECYFGARMCRNGLKILLRVVRMPELLFRYHVTHMYALYTGNYKQAAEVWFYFMSLPIKAGTFSENALPPLPKVSQLTGRCLGRQWGGHSEDRVEPQTLCHTMSSPFADAKNFRWLMQLTTANDKLNFIYVNYPRNCLLYKHSKGCPTVLHSSMTSKILQKQWWKSLLTQSVPNHSLVLLTITIVVVVPGFQKQTTAPLGGETVPWVQSGLNRTLECLSIWNFGGGGVFSFKSKF